MEKKLDAKHLKPHDKIRVAFGHYCLGIDQHDLAALFGVNPGRVSEACASIWQVSSDGEET